MCSTGYVKSFSPDVPHIHLPKVGFLQMCSTGYVKSFSPDVPHIHLPKVGQIR